MATPKIIKELFIGGRFVKAKEGKTFPVYNPADQTVLAHVQRAGQADIEDAVTAARKAFDEGPWGRMDPTDRASRLYKLADLIQRDADDLSVLESLNSGKPAHLARVVDLEMTHQVFRYYAGWVDKIRGHTLNADGPFFAYTKREPVGVVGQIIPWNFPLAMFSWKVAPALAAGCSVIIKSAEQTPLTALRIGELAQEAGIPDGVLNIVSGEGDVGSYMTKHEKIDKIAFTGSTQVGLDIMRNSHQKNLKRITLELGGKSANIITKNASLEQAIPQSMLAVFFNSGQCCNAGSRTFVHSSLYDQYVEQVSKAAASMKVGNPLETTTEQGPLVSKEQYDRVMRYIQIGVKEGARLTAGGKRFGNKGYFIEPTVFADVTDNMRIAKEQIFGPVKCIFKFDTNEEVLKRANSSNYGLAAGVVSNDSEELQWFSDRLKAGSLYLNCYMQIQKTLPFGGFKDSGIGRELGEEGLNNYLETKTVIVGK